MNWTQFKFYNGTFHQLQEVIPWQDNNNKMAAELFKVQMAYAAGTQTLWAQISLQGHFDPLNFFMAWIVRGFALSCFPFQVFLWRVQKVNNIKIIMSRNKPKAIINVSKVW
jgi:hypothetical protein